MSFRVNSGIDSLTRRRRSTKSHEKLLPRVIKRAAYASSTPIQHVRIDQRRPHIFVSEQFLHCANIVASFEQMRREAVAEGVTRAVLGDPGSPDRTLDRSL